MNVKKISGENVKNLDKDVKLIDVREKFEYENGHIKNSINLPLSEIEEGNIDLEKDSKIVVHCRTNKRAKKAIEILTNLGYKDISLAPGVELFDYNLIKN